MNRKTKGALAIGAGVIILLGGAGSLALWGDEAPVGGSDVTTGDLDLSCGAAGAWTDISADIPGNPSAVPAGALMVPGDVWEYKNDCTVVAKGKNMHAQLSVDNSSVPGSTITDPACGGSCVTFANTVAIGTGGAVTTPPPITVNDGDTLHVSVKVTFNAATPNRVGVNTALNVSGMLIKLDQVRP
ncbi:MULTISPECIES: alternate-type signal peptide domain-containing protein [Gordonia]|jgi:alternate signal-mediated exported protein|uniref:alternate-type signal peptide domain-containing protein n=1 Tax=Gordonia TaxID=2053 RepID=UPI00301780D5